MTISVRLCSGRTGFEVTTGAKIDMIRASSIFKAKVATRHLMLLNYNGVEISIYPSGRMIIKTADREESLKIAYSLLEELGISVS